MQYAVLCWIESDVWLVPVLNYYGDDRNTSVKSMSRVVSPIFFLNDYVGRALFYFVDHLHLHEIFEDKTIISSKSQVKNVSLSNGGAK